eukprot:1151094-Pelagomonas_calceolata.AAC.2
MGNSRFQALFLRENSQSNPEALKSRCSKQASKSSSPEVMPIHLQHGDQEAEQEANQEAGQKRFSGKAAHKVLQWPHCAGGTKFVAASEQKVPSMPMHYTAVLLYDHKSKQ